MSIGYACSAGRPSPAVRLVPTKRTTPSRSSVGTADAARAAGAVTVPPVAVAAASLGDGGALRSPPPHPIIRIAANPAAIWPL